jgi:release factor glutamine methyltransferase
MRADSEMGVALDPSRTALVRLGESLRALGYSFVTPTPETHRRVNSRPSNAEARTLRDIFGWSRPFRRLQVPAPIFDLCSQAQVLMPAGDDGERWTSAVRYSTLAGPTGELMFVHSAFPTDDGDAVFFGPDSYRFATLLARTIRSARRLVDVGCGTGVGGLVLAGRAGEVVLADVNPRALALAAVNVELAGSAGVDHRAVTLVVSDVLAAVEGDYDLVIANPPYLADGPGRLYRDGGGTLGVDLAVRIVDESLRGLAPGGQLLLYTGTPIADGHSILAQRLQPVLRERAASWAWQELDPDVFGEELDRGPYGQTERLAVVALTAAVA